MHEPINTVDTAVGPAPVDCSVGPDALKAAARYLWSISECREPATTVRTAEAAGLLYGAAEEIGRLREFVRDCAKNWDHDENAHRYGTLCRCCEAEKLMRPNDYVQRKPRPRETSNPRETGRRGFPLQHPVRLVGVPADFTKNPMLSTLTKHQENLIKYMRIFHKVLFFDYSGLSCAFCNLTFNSEISTSIIFNSTIARLLEPLLTEFVQISIPRSVWSVHRFFSPI
jgi:hypothetical protein